jgi:hypothetical protein
MNKSLVKGSLTQIAQQEEIESLASEIAFAHKRLDELGVGKPHWSLAGRIDLLAAFNKIESPTLLEIACAAVRWSRAIHDNSIEWTKEGVKRIQSCGLTLHNLARDWKRERDRVNEQITCER